MNRLITACAVVFVVLLRAASPVQAASCNGASHEMTLTEGTATPASGTTSTRVTFRVRYTDNAGCAPTSITVVIAGAGTFSLSASGAAYESGITFSRTLTLSVGRHAYQFAATSGAGVGERTVKQTSVAPAAVTITAPAPVPPPPTPTPVSPTPAPPAPTTPKPMPAPTVPAATSQPVAPPSSAVATVTPSPTPAPSASPIGTPYAEIVTPTELRGGSGALLPDRGGSRVIARPAPWSERVAVPARTVLKPSGWELAVPDYLLVFATSTGIGLAFFAFLTRRRATVDASDVAAAVDTVVVGDGPAAVLHLPPIRELIPPLDPHLLDIPDDRREVAPGEEGIPRWLRPSVREARFADDRSYRRYG
jgi:hypothetical protein